MRSYFPAGVLLRRIRQQYPDRLREVATEGRTASSNRNIGPFETFSRNPFSRVWQCGEFREGKRISFSCCREGRRGEPDEEEPVRQAFGRTSGTRGGLKRNKSAQSFALYCSISSKFGSKGRTHRL